MKKFKENEGMGELEQLKKWVEESDNIVFFGGA